MEEMANNGIAAHWLYKSNEDEVPKGTHARARQWVKGRAGATAARRQLAGIHQSVKIDLFPDEVYVFTPKGRIMELPKGSTAVDFAYAVHTDVGNTCIACRVNRRLAPLSQPLESGSTVEIVTAPGARPNPAWLNFVVTGKARTHIRHALKLQRRSESINLGERLLSKALSGFETSLDKISPERIQQVLAEYHMEYVEDLLEDIGGQPHAYVIARRLIAGTTNRHQRSKGRWLSAAPKGWYSTTPSAAHRSPATPSSGTCRPARAWWCTWKPAGTSPTSATIRTSASSCPGPRTSPASSTSNCASNWSTSAALIALLAGSVNAADGNIEKIGMDERDGRISVVQLVVSVHDRVHLARVIKKLRTIKGVTRITRVKA